MRDLDIHDIRIRARMYKTGLITEQELINAVEALLQQHDVSGRSEQLPQLDDETVLEPMQNALYATNRFTTDQCSTLAEGILMYLKDAKMKIVHCGN
jgi:hypothetical protein